MTFFQMSVADMIGFLTWSIVLGIVLGGTISFFCKALSLAKQAFDKISE